MEEPPQNSEKQRIASIFWKIQLLDEGAVRRHIHNRNVQVGCELVGISNREKKEKSP